MIEIVTLDIFHYSKIITQETHNFQGESKLFFFKVYALP